MSSLKKVLTSIFIGIMALCLLADGLYLVIKYCLPAKMVSQTFHVGDLTTKNDDGSTSSLGKIMEINYYANSDYSGKELFELKFNMLKDEQTDSVFSTGIQYVCDDGLSYYASHYKNENRGFLGFGGTNSYFKTMFNTTAFYYNVDGSNASYVASLPITEDNYFLITIGDEQFRMHLRKNLSADKTKLNPYYFVTKTEEMLWAQMYNYYLLDWNYLIASLLNSVRSLEVGYDGTLTFKFGDIFDYYKYDEENAEYKLVERTKKGDLIEQVINNYYIVKVNTYYTGAKIASDSMFNMIEGNVNYNTTGINQLDYSFGRQIYKLTEYDFNYVYVENDKSFQVYLKDNIKNFLANKKNYLLDITLNYSVLKENFINLSPVNHDFFVYDDVFIEDLILEVTVVW